MSLRLNEPNTYKMPTKRKDLEKVWFREARHVEEITAGDDLNSLDRELWYVFAISLIFCLL
jgi:hypothetical protein